MAPADGLRDIAPGLGHQSLEPSLQLPRAQVPCRCKYPRNQDAWNDQKEHTRKKEAKGFGWRLPPMKVYVTWAR